MPKATFNSAVAAFLAWLSTFATQLGTLATALYGYATSAYNDAVAAAGSASDASDSADTATTKAGEASDSADDAAASAVAAAGSAATAAGFTATSASSVAIGTGSKTFTTQASKQFTPGAFIELADTALPTTNWLFGQVTSYSGTTLIVEVALTAGSGTIADWQISLAGARGPTGAAGTPIPSGSILMWSGSIASIPAGYVLCDGTNSTPDLRNRFIVGAGSTYAVNATGGATSNTPTITVGSTTLSTAEMPAHTHTTVTSTGGAAGTGSGNPSPTSADTGSTGGGGSHTHTGSSSAVPTLPPYLALAYIMKT